MMKIEMASKACKRRDNNWHLNCFHCLHTTWHFSHLQCTCQLSLTLHLQVKFKLHLRPHSFLTLQLTIQLLSSLNLQSKCFQWLHVNLHFNCLHLFTFQATRQPLSALPLQRTVPLLSSRFNGELSWQLPAQFITLDDLMLISNTFCAYTSTDASTSLSRYS